MEEGDTFLTSLQTPSFTEIGAVIFTVFSIMFSGIIIPIIKISAAALVAAGFKLLFTFVFGSDVMARVVGSEGYIYYGYLLVKHYVGYGPLVSFVKDPFSLGSLVDKVT